MWLFGLGIGEDRGNENDCGVFILRVGGERLVVVGIVIVLWGLFY